MYGDVNWTSLVRATHYQVMRALDIGDGDDVLDELSGIVHRTRREAQDEIYRATVQSQIHSGTTSEQFLVWSYDEVFLPRCGECGEYPDGQYRAFLDWHELGYYTRYFPGWLATSERLVFCPRHLPAGGW